MLTKYEVRGVSFCFTKNGAIPCKDSPVCYGLNQLDIFN